MVVVHWYQCMNTKKITDAERLPKEKQGKTEAQAENDIGAGLENKVIRLTKSVLCLEHNMGLHEGYSDSVICIEDELTGETLSISCPICSTAVSR